MRWRLWPRSDAVSVLQRITRESCTPLLHSTPPLWAFSGRGDHHGLGFPLSLILTSSRQSVHLAISPWARPKEFVFGGSSAVGCMRGLQTQQDPALLASQRPGVVTSILLIIIADAVFSVSSFS